MKQLLMTPGPTPVPQKIMDKIAEPIIHHRTPEFKEVFKGIGEGLKSVFKTKNDCLIFTSSGTGAMEASVVNVLSPGDKAIVIRGGKFGERYYEICESYGVDIIPIDIEWGTAPDPNLVKDALKNNAGVKAVFTELCETSTATVYDIKALGEVVRGSDAVLIVDAISGLGADDLETDGWAVDIAVGGSQKALMLPPGLSFCTISEKAWKRFKNSKSPRYYYDFNKYKKAKEKSETPFTPAITLAVGLRFALGIIKSKGIDNVLKDCANMAKTLRDAVKDLGLQLFSKAPSNAVTAVKVPSGMDGAALIKAIKEKGITVAGGQGELKGRIIRIAHMGGITMSDVTKTIDMLKDTLKELRHGN